MSHKLKLTVIILLTLAISLPCMAQGDGGKKKRKPVKTEQSHSAGSKPKPNSGSDKRKREEEARKKREAEERQRQEEARRQQEEEARKKQEAEERQRQEEARRQQEEERRKKEFGSINGHEYVDLGLSVKWATMNVGASKPSDYGNYYAWGETRPKSDYTWANCFDCRDRKGVRWREYKIGGKTQILPTSGHDTARENWGGGWRMPTESELKELNNKCRWTWTQIDGHNGYKVTGPNGNSIFLPAAGFRYGTDVNGVGQYGLYWSGTLSSSCSSYAHTLYFNDGGHDLYYGDRSLGRSVRPVIE